MDRHDHWHKVQFFNEAGDLVGEGVGPCAEIYRAAPEFKAENERLREALETCLSVCATKMDDWLVEEVLEAGLVMARDAALAAFSKAKLTDKE